MPQARKVRFGSLDTYVLDVDPQSSPQTRPPSVLVFLCHGYGAPGDDMVGIVSEWARLLDEDAAKIRFVCPQAPESLADLGMPTGRAWWPLNMARLMEAVQVKRFDELHHESPPGLNQARAMLSGAIEEALDAIAKENRCAADDIPFAMGGFSQGAMLTMDTALRGEIRPPDYLIQFSGTVICQPRWTAAMSRLKNTRVYQSHGTVDPILPFASAERLRDLLAASKIDATFHSFVGQHTIDMDSVLATARGLHELTLRPIG